MYLLAIWMSPLEKSLLSKSSTHFLIGLLVNTPEKQTQSKISFKKYFFNASKHTNGQVDELIAVEYLLQPRPLTIYYRLNCAPVHIHVKAVNLNWTVCGDKPFKEGSNIKRGHKGGPLI